MIDLTSPSTLLRPGVAARSTNLEVRGRETSSVEPITSSGEQSIDSKIASLATLFPNAKQSNIIYAVMNYDNLDSAAEHLTELNTLTSDDSGACNANLTGAEHLKTLARKMNPYSTAEKLKVDREDLVMDVFQHYKDFNFDPSVRIKFQIRGGAVIDTGGVFLKIAKGE